MKNIILNKVMSRYLFDTICPACGRGNPGVFYHSCGGKRYIDDNLYLYCDKCNNRAFLLDSRFKCESHDDFRPIDKMAFMSSLSLMSRTSNVPKNIIRKMMNALMDNEN